MIQIKLSDKMAPSFFSVHQDVKQHGHTHYVLAGGRGSTKSSYVSLEIPLLLMQIPNATRLFCEKSQTHSETLSIHRWNGRLTHCAYRINGK